MSSSRTTQVKTDDRDSPNLVPTVELRSYVYLDRLQPQFAAFLGTNMRGYLPVVGMASMLIEIAPGVLINQVADAALKAADVRPGLMVVERHFGVLEFHSKAQADVQYSGNAALKVLGPPIEERIEAEDPQLADHS